MGSADVAHIMANSGWAWHLLAAPAIWIAACYHVPVIVHYHGGEAGRFLSREIAWVRPTLRRARHVVVPSGYLAHVFAVHGVPTRVVPNVVDLQAFRPAPTLPARPHVIVTRNLEPIYDIETALRAFAIVVRRFPDARLTVAGSGPERERLLALADELALDDHVRFTGRVDNAELPPLYRSASIVVNPSRADNMPVSLLEAFASGVPVVSTNVGGVPYMAQDQVTAMLVPAAQPQAMADAMLRVLNEPSLASRLREAGLEAASAYAWSCVRPLLFAIYAEVCAPGVAPQTSL
jgi:glycosyltransferase involved in cell wall biosynthesis